MWASISPKASLRKFFNGADFPDTPEFVTLLVAVTPVIVGDLI